MTLEELQQQVDKDFKLDDTELDTESTKIPLLHNKYLQHYNKFSLLLKKAEYEHKTTGERHGRSRIHLHCIRLDCWSILNRCMLIMAVERCL